LRKARFFKAVVADCPFANLRETVYEVCRKDRLPVFGGWLGIMMCRLRFGMNVDLVNVTQAIADLNPRPVFIIQSERDIIVSMKQTQWLMNAAREPKQFWLVPNAIHVQGFQEQPEEYRAKVIDFFQAAIP